MRIFSTCRRDPRNLSLRRGVVLAESAIVLPVMFLILFAMLDLGIATLRYNALAHASRRIAREITMHGSEAPELLGTWGSETYEGTAADSSLIVAVVHDFLPTMSRENVLVRVTWLDDDNSPRDRVQVELSYAHKPVVASLLPWGELNLRSVSTMRIIN